MRRIICLALSVIFVCFGMNVLADDNTFMREYIADSIYETLYGNYSDFSEDKNILGFYKADTDCDSEKASHIAFYTDGRVYATLSTTTLVLNFNGSYTVKDGTVTAVLENTNDYVGVEKFLDPPLTFSVKSRNELVFSGRDFSLSPKNGTKYILKAGNGFDVITVKYNGDQVEFDQAPVIINGRTMVPIRAVMEKMGCTVTWKDATKTANIKNDNAACALQVGNELMSVLDKKTNKQSVETLDSAPVIINSRLLLPLRAVAEVFDAKVDWDETTRTVLVTYDPSQPKPEDTKPVTPEKPEEGDISGETKPEEETNPSDTETKPEDTETNDEEESTTVYLKQRSEDSCTLASTAMMLRKKADLLGKDFLKITELRLKPYAWQDEGLKSSFKFETYEVSTYTHDGDDFASLLYEDKKDAIIKLLEEHPEGIVAYDYETPHAIWISSYEKETGYFYVSDPSHDVAEGIVILEESKIAGDGASAKITAIDKLWYVSSK